MAGRLFEQHPPGLVPGGCCCVGFRCRNGDFSRCADACANADLISLKIDKPGVFSIMKSKSVSSGLMHRYLYRRDLRRIICRPGCRHASMPVLEGRSIAAVGMEAGNIDDYRSDVIFQKKSLQL